MQEKGAVVMHALTQAMEAAVSRFRHDDVEAKAVQVITLLNRSMTCPEGMGTEESAQALEQAVQIAEELAYRGYGGFAQAIGQAMHFYYSVPQGEVEALCFGWIDSTNKRLSDGRLAQRLSPRRQGSHWTELSILRCNDLLARGLMTEAGLHVMPLE